MAGGLVTIDHITSTAKETTDGAHAVGAGDTVVSGLRIGGVAATVDNNGVHIGALTAVANQALKNLGLALQITAPDTTTDGAKGSFAAPVLVVNYRDDQNALEQAAIAMGQKLTTGALQQVTGSLQQLALGPQAKVTLSLGGATATVDGSPSEPLPPDAAAGEAPSTAASSVSLEAPSAVSGGTAVEGTTFASPSTPAKALRSARTAAVPARPTGLLDGWAGLAWGLVLAAVLGGLAMSYGLYRYALASDAVVPGGPSSDHH